MSIYLEGIERVIERAAKLGVELPPDILKLEAKYLENWTEAQSENSSIIFHPTLIHTRIGGAIMDHIEDYNIRFIFRLIEGQSFSADWHYVLYSEDCMLQREDHIEVARSRNAVLERVREAADDEFLEYSEEEQSDGLVLFIAHGDVIATVGRVIFREAINKKIVQLADRRLSKITTKFTSAVHLEQILAPLVSARFVSDVSADLDHDYTYYTNLNSLAKAMKRGLCRLNPNISLGHSQELLAAFFKFDSWNHLRALEKEALNGSCSPSVVFSTSLGQTDLSFFKNEAAAFAYFAKQFSDRIPEIEAEFCSVYGLMQFRSPPYSRPLHHGLSSDFADGVISMQTLMQIDRYVLDETNPIGCL